MYDVGEHDGVQFLSMAYVEGRPLSKLIQDQHPLPQNAVADLVRKLALALDEAHAKRVVHRDLKPANIMINKRHEPVIMDFGLARREDTCDTRLTVEGAVMGTPDFMAPEQVAGDTEKIGAATDIYALGVILYQLLTGRLPFEGSAGEVMGKISLQPPPPPSQHRPDIDPQLESICLQALNKKAEDRFSSMAEFAGALSEFLDARHDLSVSAGSRAGSLVRDDRADAGGPPDESRASDLLHWLAAQVESGKVFPDSQVTVEHRIRGAWPIVTVAAAAVILLAAMFVWAPWRGDEPQLVAVQLVDIDVWINNPDVTFFIDSEPVSGQELAQPLRLSPGRHVLEVRRGERVEAVYDIPISSEAPQQTVALGDHRRDAPPRPGDSGAGPAKPPPAPAAGPPRAEPPRPPTAPVDSSFAIAVRPYYDNTRNDLHSTLVINDKQVARFTNATRQNIADYFHSGWNTLVLETAAQNPAEQWNILRFDIGRVAKSADGAEVMTPMWFLSNGQNWELREGRFTHQLGPDVERVRLSFQLFYAGFDLEDRELAEGDFVIERTCLLRRQESVRNRDGFCQRRPTDNFRLPQPTCCDYGLAQKRQKPDQACHRARGELPGRQRHLPDGVRPPRSTTRTRAALTSGRWPFSPP